MKLVFFSLVSQSANVGGPGYRNIPCQFYAKKSTSGPKYLDHSVPIAKNLKSMSLPPCRDADLYHLNRDTDPNPAFHFNADPDPTPAPHWHHHIITGRQNAEIFNCARTVPYAKTFRPFDIDKNATSYNRS